MKIITKLGLAVMLFMATTVFNNVMAQKYGGSAYVHVRNSEGKNRVLTTTISCTYVSESNAKTELEKSLLSKKRVGDEYNSQIYYDIDLSRKDDKYLEEHLSSFYLYIPNEEGSFDRFKKALFHYKDLLIAEQKQKIADDPFAN